MSRPDLNAVSQIADVLARKEQARLLEINQQESQLRLSLERLDQQVRTTSAAPLETYYPMRHIGADLIWQSWVGRTRSDLNRQLALCLARKAELLKRARVASGRQMAVNSLLAAKKEEDRRSALDDQVKALEELGRTVIYRR